MTLNVCGFCLAYCDNNKNKIIHLDDCPLAKDEITHRNRVVKNMNRERCCTNCDSVGGKDGRLLACSVCSTVFYCGSKCQKENWSSHKKRFGKENWSSHKKRFGKENLTRLTQQI